MVGNKQLRFFHAEFVGSLSLGHGSEFLAISSFPRAQREGFHQPPLRQIRHVGIRAGVPESGASSKRQPKGYRSCFRVFGRCSWIVLFFHVFSWSFLFHSMFLVPSCLKLFLVTLNFKIFWMKLLEGHRAFQTAVSDSYGDLTQPYRCVASIISRTFAVLWVEKQLAEHIGHCHATTQQHYSCSCS